MAVAVEARVVLACPNACHAHGVCQSGKCACAAPFYGSDCLLEYALLLPNVPATSAVAHNTWHYYYVPVYGQNALRVHLALHWSQEYFGSALAFVRRSGFPSLTTYDYTYVLHTTCTSLTLQISCLIRDAVGRVAC